VVEERKERSEAERPFPHNKNIGSKDEERQTNEEREALL